eukprot:2847164-Karenia_brevis.AAC.1
MSRGINVLKAAMTNSLSLGGAWQHGGLQLKTCRIWCTWHLSRINYRGLPILISIGLGINIRLRRCLLEINCCDLATLCG